jgi:hypothetical protein
MNDRMAHWDYSIFTDLGVEANNVYILNSVALPGLIV